jgi:hypothetical protein
MLTLLPYLALLFAWLLLGIFAFLAIDEFADSPITSDWPPLFCVIFWPLFLVGQLGCNLILWFVDKAEGRIR